MLKRCSVRWLTGDDPCLGLSRTGAKTNWRVHTATHMLPLISWVDAVSSALDGLISPQSTVRCIASASLISCRRLAWACCAHAPLEPPQQAAAMPLLACVTEHSQWPVYAEAHDSGCARISFLARSHTLTLTCLQLLSAPDPCISNMTELAWTDSEPTWPAACSGAAWSGSC